MRPGQRKKWFCVILAILVALLAIKVLVVITGKPKPTVDYVAEYNRITKPENFDPSKNAAPYYQKAIDSFVESSRELNGISEIWPGDMDAAQKALLQEWMDANAEAFEYFKKAAEKPYYWVELKSTDGSLHGIVTPSTGLISEIARALNRRAQLDASEGRGKEAADNIIYCYKAGQQLYEDPYLGTGVIENTVKNAILILKSAEFDNEVLEHLQDSLSAETVADIKISGIELSVLSLKDLLQRSFVYNRKGTGRLAWRCAHWFYLMHGRLANMKFRLACFTGPTENKVLEQIEQISLIYQKLMHLSLPEAKKSGYFDEVKAISKDNFFLESFGKSREVIFTNWYEVNAQNDALIAIIAILRYNNDKGDFPEMLYGLIGAGYLEQVPVDPFSDEGMVYKRVDDDFRLYSVGEDLSDDGGEFVIWEEVKSPLYGTGHNPRKADIIYWPPFTRANYLREQAGRRPERVE